MPIDPKSRKQVDWEAIEREYRAGQLSVSEVGRIYGVSHTAINKKAKKEGWTRNLAEKVREEVSARLVSDGVSAKSARETVELAAERQIKIIREHRQDIAAGRNMARGLFDELREASDNRDEIEAAIEDETKGDRSPKRRNMMLKAVSLGSRASTLFSLSGALKNLIGLERQAVGLSNGSDGGDGADPAPVTRIERVVVDPQNSDAKSISPASEES
jgi:hypothetical protein